jgi:putative DNA primase/helicase
MTLSAVTRARPKNDSRPQAAGPAISDELRALGLLTLGDDPPPDAVDAFLRRWAGSRNGADSLRIRLEREAIVKSGIKAGVVDAALHSYRSVSNAKFSGSAPSLEDPNPWDEPVSGENLLESLVNTFTRFLSLPPGCAPALALWTVHAHAHDAAEISPILAITSPEKRCGKTTLLEVLSVLVPRALPAANLTSAVTFRAVEEFCPTLLVDEADTFLTRKDELRGVLNSGHRRSMARVIRAVGEDYEPRVFRTWAPKAIALIGKLPGTLADRSIEVRMRRRTPSEVVERLRLDQLSHLEPLCRMTCRWVQDEIDRLRILDPPVPESLHDRAADNWRPLLAIADSAGGDWPRWAREAALTLDETSVGEDASLRTQLLHDLHEIFAASSSEKLPSQDIVAALVKREDRPWPEYRNAKPLTSRQLARLLEPFQVRPKALWVGGRTLRGYVRDDLRDTFRRYLQTETLQAPQESPTDAASTTAPDRKDHTTIAGEPPRSDTEKKVSLHSLHAGEGDSPMEAVRAE